MIELSLAEIAEAVGGTIFRGAEADLVSGVSTTDSRSVEQGGIFFAKVGANDDGHRHLAAAVQAGAALAILQQPDEAAEINQIVVADSVAALSDLAKLVLSRVRSTGNLTVIGITGSNGKTSTKNMLREILSPLAPTVAPIGSYNNLVGLPTTVLRIDHETRYLILEYGAAGLGSIAKLAAWTLPDIAVVLKVGLAHAGAFGGIDVTAKIKAELVEFATKQVVLNFDDPVVRAMETRVSVAVSGFGYDENASTRITATDLSLDGTKVSLRIGDTNSELSMRILGEHQAMNAAAALEVSRLLGIETAHCLKVLSEMEMAERWRMQLLRSDQGFDVINDAYNASPDSMKAALQSLAVIGRSGHRTVAVLGAMAELGEISDQEHHAIGLLVVRYNIDKLFVVGQDAKVLHLAATAEGSWDGESEFFGSVSEAFEPIRASLEPNDVVLVKSSNAAGLRFLGDQLAGVK
ncbi:MAG: UDP-N-acetylmuramoyl-tripeptide--D-alanyl-D-alanine ligase [Aquiluna sp.]|nr:UDP-N-acetylmuramoyl-tripeptide--D-alanyl-D-alanine ligase [Aquiluna sp.]